MRLAGVDHGALLRSGNGDGAVARVCCGAVAAVKGRDGNDSRAFCGRRAVDGGSVVDVIGDSPAIVVPPGLGHLSRLRATGNSELRVKESNGSKSSTK